MYTYGKGIILSNNTTKTTVTELWVGGHTTKESHMMFTISFKILLVNRLKKNVIHGNLYTYYLSVLLHASM